MLTESESEISYPCQACGPYSQCRVVNEQSVCSCLPTYTGSPPSCRPECTVSADCPLSRACVNQKCVDPCINTCGQNAVCRVLSHSPFCTCKPGFTGEPFSRCFPLPSKKYFFLNKTDNKIDYFSFRI